MDTLDSLLEDDMLVLLLADDDLPTAHQTLASVMPAVAVDGPLPLSFAQQRLWFLQQLDPASSAYNLPRVVRLQGALDAERLERALNRVIERHAILSTRFITQAGEPMQVVENSMPLALQRVSLRHLDETALASETERRIAEESAQPFDLSKAPLIRATLLETGEHQHLLLLTMHHIVSDAWSNPLLVADLTQAYALPAGQRLPQLPRQYSDYAHWQRQTYPTTAAFSASGAYWRNYLAGELTPLSLPYDHPHRPGQNHVASYHVGILDADLRQRLDTLCREHKLQPMVVLLAAWQLLLGRYSGQSDFTIGIPSATRSHSETHELVGLFVSSLVYRARLDPCQSGLDLLQRLKQESLQALEHVDYPFELLLDDLDLQRSSLANPLFQTMFNWRVSTNDNAPLTLGELQVEMLDSGSRQSKFDLSLDVDHGPDGTAFSLEYSTDLFEPASVARLAQHWQQLLLGLVSAPRTALGELPMLAPAEADAILHGLNQTYQDYSGEFRVQRLFEAQARLRPDATALIFADQHLTYAQLDQRANRLAHALREHGVGPETLVGIAAERSLEMVIALLAILKAGGAYVPLDPEYPADRLAYMFEDSRIALLLTQPHLQAQLPTFDGTTLLLDQDFAAYPEHAPDVEVEGEHPAYVIYTSGSTGRPKGVMVRHHGLGNLMHWSSQLVKATAEGGLLQRTSMSFDASVWELFWPLCAGLRLILAQPTPQLDPEYLIDLVQQQSISVMQFVPALLQQFLATETCSACESLTDIVCGGGELTVALVQQLRERLPQARLHNVYGPTEATVDSSAWTLLPEQPLPTNAPPIGSPIPNLACWILDANLQPQPYGVIGELYLGDAGLARGYHQRPALTAERFVVCPFQSGARMYRTGDLARYRKDGLIEYIGRIDHQVKIRGLRIELGEIEALLMELPGIRDAAVLAINSQLIGYLVTRPGQLKLESQQLREALLAHLPEYMVPHQWLYLDSLPLTPNGKLDRRALPIPEAGQQEYVAPRNEREATVVAIWESVLGVEPIGLHDHFFERGGHSLLATRVISQVRDRLDVDVELRQLFEQPRLLDFLNTLGQQSVTRIEIPQQSREHPLPLSFAQQRQWVLWQLAPDSAAYNIPTSLRLRGALDLDALQQAFNALIARHEPLRTTFTQVDDTPCQIIHPTQPLALAVEDMTGITDEALQAEVEAEFLRPFDLTKGPLLRVRLLRLATDEHALVMTLHHIITDGWSNPILIEEMVHFYQAFSQGQAPSLPPLAIQYADFAAWQRDWLDEEQRQRQLAFWREHLGDEHPVLNLPLDRPRSGRPSHQGATVALEIPQPLANALRRVALAQGVTPFVVLLASFQTLLHRYSGQADIRVGIPLANRTQLQTERLIGFFVNTQVLRSVFDGQTFNTLLNQLGTSAVQAQTWQELPFEQLVEALQPERTLGIHPLFQVLFNYQHGGIKGGLQVPGLQVEGLRAERQAAQFDLSLSLIDQPESIHAAFNYATDLFNTDTVEQLGRHWLNLLQAIAEQPDSRVDELPLLDAPEADAILYGLNQTQQDYPGEFRVQRLFEAQARLHPDATALIFADQHLTYAQLDQRANRLAHALREHGVGPETLVGIAAERSLEMVIALLAILKAGGAYVPLDPEYPADRLAYMFEDSRIALLLTQPHLQAQLPSFDGTTLLLDQDFSAYPAHAPDVEVEGEHLVYVIYTSGSTGKPKGAGNRHRALFNRLAWMQQAYRLDSSDRVLQKTPFSFDVSVWEFFWPLIEGACLVIASPGEHREPHKLIATIERHQVSTLHFVPSMLQVFMHEPGVERCTSLRRIVCSGEALQVDAQQQVFAKIPGAGLYNLYGPTEAAIDVTHWTCRDEGLDNVPIGEPIANLYTHILDQGLGPVPMGVQGELLLGGEGLARGYHRRPALTAERFIPDPFATTPGARVYRTGDLAKYRPDGVIDYCGRIDHQVKIRGLRIELGEIEARLLEHPSVREAVVLAQPGPSGLQLVAYAVASDVQASELQQALREHLPEFMVPSHLLLLDALPVTPNGKLDRRALPMPEAGQQEYVAPQTEHEQQLVQLWREVLRLEQVGVTDNFFELGGDSIVSIQLVSRARRQGLVFTPKDLFEHQTIKRLAMVVSELDGALQIDQGPVQGTTALLPFQQWFFEQDIPQRHHWNQAVLLKPTQVLDADRLERALKQLAMHHDALRLHFNAGQAHFAEQPAPHALWMRALDNAAQLPELGDEAQASLAPERGELLRAVLTELVDGSQRLLLVIHHLVVDGVSWRILLEDLHSAYLEQPLPPKTTAVSQWADRLGEFARGSQGLAQLPFWQGQLDGAEQPLPDALPDAPCTLRHAGHAHTRLDRETTQQLLQQAPAAYRTQINDLLLTALARTLCRWSNNEHMVVQLEGHGREDLFNDVDLTRSVGWFTSFYPVKLSPCADMAGSIKTIKEQLRAVPDKGLGFCALRYLGDESTRKILAALPTPRITFNYLGQFDNSFDDTEDSLFIPSGEGNGRSQFMDAPLGNWLEINGRVYAGELSLEWRFSEAMFKVQAIQSLADDLTVELRTLINHCLDDACGAVTPSDVPLAGLDQASLDRLPGSPRQLENLYPLSPMQQGMLFHAQLGDGEGDYVQQLRLDVTGLDIERLRAAWQATLNNHDILRTSFLWNQDLNQPLQRVERHLPAIFEVHAAGSITADLLAEQDRKRGFDLTQAPLLRWAALAQGSNAWHLVFTSHHILLDGWSTSQLFAELLQRYHGVPIASRGGRFSEYITWLQARNIQSERRFWKDYLSRQDEPSLLAPVTRALEANAPRHLELQHAFDSVRTQQLEQFARSTKVTVNTLVQAAWALTLQRETRQHSVIFGVTVAGRPQNLPGVEHQLGLFINTLPLIVPLPSELTLDGWLKTLQADNLALREHEHSPLYELQQQFGGAMFDTLLVFENYPVAETLEEQTDDRLQFERIDVHEQTHYPVSLAVSLSDRLSIKLQYRLDSLTPAQAQQLLDQLTFWLLTLSDSSAQLPIGELGLQPLIQHEVTTPHAGKHCLHQLFSIQVARTPQAIALVHGEQTITYAELDQQSNAVAHLLLDYGLSPETRVGLALPANSKRVAALLGILKAGGAYVPLDPSYPEERLRHIIDDSGLKVVICDSTTQAALSGFTGPILLLDQVVSSELTDLALPDCSPLQLAYVIYTSGSTGKPKGVAVAHHAVASHCLAAAEYYGLDKTDRLLQFASISFDAATEQLLMPLLCGASALLGDARQWTSEALADALEQHSVSYLDLPPSYFFETAKVLHSQGRQLQIKTCILGGEGWNRKAFDDQDSIRCENLINAYGPTEAVITPMAWTVPQTSKDTRLAIGRPLGARTVHLVDSHLRPVPDGIAGELLLGGTLLAEGYLAQPGLTAERFLPDPFGAQGARLYRTGDLAENEQGESHYLGRIDQQLKLRGLRIETGEIEARLRELSGVQHSLVMRHPRQETLLGYVSFESEQAYLAADTQAIKSVLGEQLPAYMVPAEILLLERWPTTHNGKIDTRRLPLPAQRQKPISDRPVSATCLRMQTIWAQVLELESVGPDDNFFELGGHSLKVLMAVATIKAQLGHEISLHTFIQQPSLRELCAYLDGQGQNRGAIVDLNRSSSPRTLYCLHPAGGSSFCYYPLASALAEQMRVKGLMFHDYVRTDADMPRPTWSQMVEDYTEQLLRDQLEGSFYLLGWSLGGPLAMHIAQRLKDHGREVTFLGLLDPTPEHMGPLRTDAVKEMGAAPVIEGAPRLQVLTNLLSELFPAHAEAAEIYCIAQANPLLDETTIRDFITWAVAVADISRNEAQMLFSDSPGGREVAVGKAVFKYLAQLSEDLTYPTQAVAPHCCWSTIDTPEYNLHSQRLAQLSPGQRVASSKAFEVPHSSLAYSTDVIKYLSQLLAV